MVIRDAKAGEVVLVGLHLRALERDKAHARAGREDLSQRLRHRVKSAAPPRTARQCDVERAVYHPLGERGGVQLLAAPLQRLLEYALEEVRCTTHTTSLLRIQFREPPQNVR